jgi:hypothetical protein|tara:strand:+ start:635 stop:745 length:111 start_codon:yes stop_codon:yes gene_type:complete
VVEVVDLLIQDLLVVEEELEDIVPLDMVLRLYKVVL